MPQPRPKFEIYVYGQNLEGVHLRAGAIARGGIRWSERLDDFRSEVLGLVKTQKIKNHHPSKTLEFDLAYRLFRRFVLISLRDELYER